MRKRADAFVLMLYAYIPLSTTASRFYVVCGMQFVAAASLTPPADTTMHTIAASSLVDVTVTNCPSTARAPAAATVSQLTENKARLLLWRVKMQALALHNGVFNFSPGKADAVRVDVLYSRHRQQQHRAVVSGIATAEGGKLANDKTQVCFAL